VNYENISVNDDGKTCGSRTWVGPTNSAMMVLCHREAVTVMSWPDSNGVQRFEPLCKEHADFCKEEAAYFSKENGGNLAVTFAALA
jgi:hypothetical protein